jgi:hypothetical protein
MEDPDICLQQLQAANREIENTDNLNKGIEATRARLKRELDDANADYNAKQKVFNNAVTTFNNYKQDQSRKAPSNYTGCHDNWNWESADRNCRHDYIGRFPAFGGVGGGAKIDHALHYCGSCSWCWGRWLECIMPNPETYAINGRAIEEAKTQMETAERDKNSKKKSYEDSLAMVFKTASINLACCTNNVSCAPGANCSEISQNCEAKISAAKEEKSAKEIADKEAADKEAADKEAAAKEAADKKAADKEAEDSKAISQKNNPSAVIKKSNYIGPTSSTESSSNNLPIIGGGLSSCCCFCIIIILIIIIIMK